MLAVCPLTSKMINIGVGLEQLKTPTHMRRKQDGFSYDPCFRNFSVCMKERVNNFYFL